MSATNGALFNLFKSSRLGYYSYICNVASNNDNGPVAALERPLPLLFHLSFNTFNDFQRFHVRY